MSDELGEVVATEYGLDDEAARFLTGSTLAEMEESAAALVKLMGRGEGQEDPRP